MSERDARDAARRAFGGPIEQTRLRHRDARSFRWIDELWSDGKVGVRLLFKHPGLTIVGGLGMAVAIAISTVLFAMLYAVVTSTLPLHEGGRIVALENWDTEVNNEWRRALYDYRVWRDELKSFEELGAFRTVTRNLVVPGGSVEPISLAEVTASAFRIARVPPLLGRTLIDADEQPGARPVLVVGHDVWRSRLGSDPLLVGRDVRLGNSVYTVVGVMPEDFLFPVRHSYWAPLGLAPSARVGMEALINRVDVDFFDAFERRLLTGRSFTTSDRLAASGTLPGSPVVIVNRTFVRQILADGVTLGRRVRYAPTADEQTESPWYEIVGVVEDLHQNSIDPQILEPTLSLRRSIRGRG